jgi:phosphatidylglycerophosphate synthase
MQPAEPVRRTSEIEEVSNLYVIHPIASWLTPRFAALGIHPNAVSLAGMGFGVLAGVAYHGFEARWRVVIGFALMIAWHVMDGADGQLARLTNKQSPSGKVLDGICDYVTFIAVYAGLASALAPHFGAAIWLLAAAAGLCHALQSAAYEVQRQEYNFWGLGRLSAAFAGLPAVPPGARSLPPGRRLADLLHRAYLRLQFVAAGVTVAFHQKLSAALDAGPERSAMIRQRYRETFAPSVRRWAALSANYRTLGIFLFALAGVPQYYFWFEIFGFNAILLVLLRQRRARYARFFAELEQA